MNSADVTPSPLSAKDRYTASPTPARRQLFSPGKQQQPPPSPSASASASSSPAKQLTPIAPKPPVRVTPIVQLFSLLQQQNKQNQTPGVTVATPKTSTQTTPSVAAQDSIQALVSLATMTSPLKISPDKNRSVTSGVPSSSSDSPVHPSSAPIITVSCPSTPTTKQSQTPQKQGATTPSATAPKSSSPPRPKRTGSVALFYRKVYQMAFLRIKDLCERLALREDILQK